MPRHPRLFLPDAVYHVYCRVARGEFVFSAPPEANGFIRTLQMVRDSDGYRIIAWCLMGNHYHLVLKTGRVPLWRSMLRLQADVARRFNRRHGYRGRLWQSRYRARIVDSQDYFRQAVSYVHLNPVHAGIVQDPADYPYSGHSEIIGRSPPRLVDLEAALTGFDHASRLGARRRYLRWVRAVAESGLTEERIGQLPWWKDAKDINVIVPAGRYPDAELFNGETDDDARLLLELDEFAALYQSCTRQRIEELASRSKSRDLVQQRIDFATLAVDRYGIACNHVAELLNKHPSSLTRWLNTGLQQVRRDLAVRRRLDEIDSNISAAALSHRASDLHVA